MFKKHILLVGVVSAFFIAIVSAGFSGKYEALNAQYTKTTKDNSSAADVTSKANTHKTIFGGLGANRLQNAAKSPRADCTCRCGERNDATRIVGGQEASMNEFPWMARLTYFNRFYCGGMLINDRYVLTAAHCVKGFMWFMIKVTFGEHDRCDDSVRPETRFAIRAIAQQFSFANFENDMALLRLNEPVPFNDVIRPICLPENADELYEGVIATTTGWGTLKEDGKTSCILMEVDVPILGNSVCRNQTSYSAKSITDNMLCAGYLNVGKKDACQGDSGGPLVVQRPDKRYELVGVVSWGNGCARPAYPGVYTRVTRYLDWIRENSKDGCFCKD